MISGPLFLRATSASADTCTYDSGTKTVTLAPGAGTISSGDATICGQTFDQIDTVIWPGTSANDTFVLNVAGGTFTPAATPDPDGFPEIKFQLDPGDGTDVVDIEGVSLLTYDIVASTSGIDLNGDGDVDVTIADAEHLKIRLGAGDDVVDASAGLPAGINGMTVEAGPGTDTIHGSPEGDTIYFDGSNDTIDAGNGDDTVSLRDEWAANGTETPTFDGGAGVDTFRWDDSGEAATADLHQGTVTWSMPVGGSGSITGFEDLVGGSDADTLIGDEGNNVLDGGPGIADVLQGRGGDDTLSSEGGSAWADYGDANGVSVDLEAGTASGDGTDTLIGIPNAIGSPGNDTIHGLAEGSSFMLGGSGNDTISGGGVEDTLVGGPGDDELSGGAGPDDILGGRGTDTVFGGPGADDISGGSGADLIHGGSGTDAWYAKLFSIATEDEQPTNGASVNLAAGVVADDGFGDADTTSGIEKVFGTPFADRLAGDAGDNVLSGGGGNDWLAGGPGDDGLDGGLGRDTVTFGSATRPIDLDLATGTSAGFGHDTLGSIEVVLGGPKGDILRGSSADDRLEGRGGDDRLIGRDGDDALIGGPGADVLVGGDGHDTCNGGGSNDTAKQCEIVWRVP